MKLWHTELWYLLLSKNIKNTKKKKTNENTSSNVVEFQYILVHIYYKKDKGQHLGNYDIGVLQNINFKNSKIHLNK